MRNEGSLFSAYLDCPYKATLEIRGEPGQEHAIEASIRRRVAAYRDAAGNWRVIYRVDQDAIVIAEVFRKKTRKTPQEVKEVSKERLRRYDNA